MNEKLAFEILTRIKDGKMNGYVDILNDLQRTETYMNLKAEEFVKVINELKEDDCIRNISDGHSKTYMISPAKDCFSYYQKRIAKTEEKEAQEEASKTLSDKKLRFDVLNAERVYKTYHSTRIMAIVGAVSGLIAILLKVAESLGWLPSHK